MLADAGRQAFKAGRGFAHIKWKPEAVDLAKPGVIELDDIAIVTHLGIIGGIVKLLDDIGRHLLLLEHLAPVTGRLFGEALFQGINQGDSIVLTAFIVGIEAFIVNG